MGGSAIVCFIICSFAHTTQAVLMEMTSMEVLWGTALDFNEYSCLDFAACYFLYQYYTLALCAMDFCIQLFSGHFLWLVANKACDPHVLIEIESTSRTVATGHSSVPIGKKEKC